MTNIASVSQSQLSNRRKQLRRTRRIKFYQRIWRTFLVGGIAGSLLWAITLPDWMIRHPEQIEIQGNYWLSAEAIRSLLPLSYPQSLLQVQPQVLAEFLESEAPIASALVSRQLIPPGLTIQIRERQPVAIAEQSKPQTTKTKNSTPTLGLVDEQGIWSPKSSYEPLSANLKLPKLKVIGQNSVYRPYWFDVYQAVSHSAVKVFEIDWRNPANLILKTDLGNVHLGPYTERFPTQLRVLDQMRELPKRTQKSKIAFIDLQNPDLPSIQMMTDHDSVQLRVK